MTTRTRTRRRTAGLARSIALAGLAAGLVVACRNSAPGTSVDAADDAGPSYPDASVLLNRDGGEDGGVPAPSLERVTPSSGSELGGTRVTLSGRSFIEPVSVDFGEIAATDVFLLDEFSVAATTPAGSIGPVRVRIETAGGSAVLEDGFTYHREVRVDRVEPARLPERGGTAVVILGTGFDDHTLVLFDRQPLRGAVRVDGGRITGYAPPLPPGRPELMVVSKDAIAARSDIVVVFSEPRVVSLSPGYGPVDGSHQSIQGTSLLHTSFAEIGGARVRRFDVVDPSRVDVTMPALTKGAKDVVVGNGDARGVLARGFIAFDPNSASLEVLGVLPAVVEWGRSTEATIVGSGFDDSTEVRVANLLAETTTVSPHAMRVRLPIGLPRGLASIEVRNGAARVALSHALDVRPRPVVTRVTPSRGSVNGGDELIVEGEGFAGTSSTTSTQTCSLALGDVPLSEVTVVSDREVRGRTVAGPQGVQALRVTCPGGDDGVLTTVVEDAFRFEEPFDVIRVDPTEGSVAGGTYVSVFGRGFDEPVSVMFGGLEGAEAHRENGSVLGVRSPRSAPRVVDVEIFASSRTTTRERDYAFYNPRLAIPGAFGGPIRGSVNVAVLGVDGSPVPKMVVQLGDDGESRYSRVTDEDGLATVSSPEIRGAQTVTVGGLETEFVTFREIDATNLTVVSAPFPRSPADDAPVTPCPEAATPPIVRGRIFKVKSSLDPSTSPASIPVVFVTYAQPSVFASNPPDAAGSSPPLQTDQVFADGDAYEISIQRVGTVAVYAVLGDYDTETFAFVPRRLGLRRHVTVAAGAITEGIDVALDIALDRSVEVRMGDLPLMNPDSSIAAVFTYLSLGSDGAIGPSYFTWPVAQAIDGSSVTVAPLPDVAETELVYLGGSFTLGRDGSLRSPYSLTVRVFDGDFSAGVDLGPFVGMPQNLHPKPGELLRRGTVSWTQTGPSPDLTRLSVQDVRSVSGRCCEDDNANGSCEDTEAVEGGFPFPQVFTRWTVFAPAGSTEISLPRMAGGLFGLEAPRVYGYVLEQAIVLRFDFDEFSSAQFSPFFWRSWSTLDSTFLAKEETD